ncbi:MAG TPA: hypothetical protein VF989_07930 [Polyangiaceae bacterium]
MLQELSGNDARMRFINTRLILSVGVDLYAEEQDPGKAELAEDTLKKMGFLKLTGGRQ